MSKPQSFDPAAGVAAPRAGALGAERADALFGTDRSEEFLGTAGNDEIHAGAGNDRVFGDDGDDGLAGDDGNDRIVGGEGDDMIVGGAGIDRLEGGEGDDRFVFRAGFGTDTVEDYEAGDTIDLRTYSFAGADEVLSAFRQVGNHAVLDLGDGDQLILKHTQVTDLDPAKIIVSDEATGPSSSQSPYIVGIDPSISTVSLLTVGDQAGVKEDGTPWRMVGLPDGLGAFDNGDGTFTVLMNHELSPTAGAVRDHGSTGAFVSTLVIDKETLAVVDGGDLIQRVFLYDSAGGTYVEGTTQFNRFCSADLPDSGAFYNPETGLGYDGGRIFINGEESGTEGRAFAHIASGAEAGDSYELAWLGNFAWENAVARPYASDATVVAGLDDGQNGQVYFYFGEKQADGNAVEKAGLAGGALYGLEVAEFTDETSAADPLGADGTSAFSLVSLGDVSAKTGAVLDAESEAAGVTSFLRPEDGAWDTQDPNRFYFVSTNGFNEPSRLWALDFVDPTDPSQGGTISLLLDGTEGQQMMDNITVNKDGKIIIQEDPGNQSYVAKIWEYDPVTDKLTLLAGHDPDRFVSGGTGFLTQDEESSGVIDVSDILGTGGQNAYLIDVQAHYNIGGELVQGGQLLVMYEDKV